MANAKKWQSSGMAKEIPALYHLIDGKRRATDGFKDYSLQDAVRLKWGLSKESFFEEVGINPGSDTISNIFQLPDADGNGVGRRWLVSEIICDAIKLGLRKTPIYNKVIAYEQNIAQTTVQTPYWNMSEATPRRVGELETIPLGTVSFGKKSSSIYKMGRGIQLSYEVVQYVSANIVSIFLQDMGVKFGMGLDSWLIDNLINGDQAGGVESAPVIGVETAGTLTYRDLLQIWIRFARIGRKFQSILAGETTAIYMLDMDEFKTRYAGTPLLNLNMSTPIPTSANVEIHGSVPADQLIFVDSSKAVIKYNAQPLLIETEKIIQNQAIETYASMTTGFVTMFQDGRAILDMSVANTDPGLSINDYSYLDVDAAEQVQIS